MALWFPRAFSLLQLAYQLRFGYIVPCDGRMTRLSKLLGAEGGVHNDGTLVAKSSGGSHVFLSSLRPVAKSTASGIWWVTAQEHRCLRMPRVGIRRPGDGASGTYKLPHVVLENQLRPSGRAVASALHC